MLGHTVTALVAFLVGWVGHMTWPKWTGWLERRAAANKLKAAQTLVSEYDAAKAAIAASKVIPVPIPKNPLGPTGPTGA